MIQPKKGDGHERQEIQKKTWKTEDEGYAADGPAGYSGGAGSCRCGFSDSEVYHRREKAGDGDVHGNWYVIKNEYFDARFTSTVKKCRIATPEEIAEYKVALNFHKHGRKPFEVKEGDLIESKSGRNIIVFYPENYSRVSFLKDGWGFLKTVEEVNEWIKGE